VITVKPEQLPLNIRLRDDASFATFYPGENSIAIFSLQAMARGEGEQQLMVWGGQGTGKTHLLQAACHLAGECGRSALYLPLRELRVYGAEVLEGTEQIDMICLDDVDEVAGDEAWEFALFHFINRQRQSGGALVMTATENPRHLPIGLPDLESRLQWGPVFQLKDLDDEAKIQALRLRAQRRGLDLPDEVGQYLLRQYPRDLGYLMDMLEELDLASLTAKRRLTIPFIRSVLNQS
jgi:DnaA family protein